MRCPPVGWPSKGACPACYCLRGGQLGGGQVVEAARAAPMPGPRWLGGDQLGLGGRCPGPRRASRSKMQRFSGPPAAGRGWPKQISGASCVR